MPSTKYGSFQKLEKIYNIPLDNKKTKQLANFLRSNMLLERAEMHKTKNDHEECYIDLMKYLSLITYLQNKDRRAFEDLNIGSNCAKALTMAEEVKTKLKELYAVENQGGITEPPVKTIEEEEEEDYSNKSENVTAAGLYSRVKGSYNKASILFVDIRCVTDYNDLHIGNGSFPVHCVNVPQCIISRGISAQSLESCLPENSLAYWRNRKSYEQIIIIDQDDMSNEAEILRNILINYDRDMDNNAVYILEKGFKNWVQWYPFTLSKPVSKVSGQEEEIPLFNLDSVHYEFDIDSDERPQFDRSTKPVAPISIKPSPTPTVDRSSKASALKTYELKDLLKEKDEVIKGLLKTERIRRDREIKLEEELRKQKKTENDQERFDISVEEENRLLKEIAQLKTDSLLKDERIQKLEAKMEETRFKQLEKTPEEVQIEQSIIKNTVEMKKVQKENIQIETERMKEEARCRPKPQLASQRPIIDRSVKPQPGRNPVIGKDPGLTGLKNLGNTCYMNSILQCLSNNTDLADYFVNKKYKLHLNKNQKTWGQVAEQMAVVLRTLWSGQVEVATCTDFKKIVGSIKSEYRSCDQQDSHEFLTFLMDWLHNDLKLEVPSDENIEDIENEMEMAWKSFITKNSSFISSIFYGLQKSTVTCSRCNAQSATYEPFSNLSLTIPDGESIHLSKCLALYLKTELISGWRCPKCNDKRQAEKVTEFCRLPQVLVIHLKRFSFLDIHSKKKTTFVDFPLDNFMVDHQPYSLYGVSNHYGTMEGGHYTAYCKNPTFKRWFKFDDQEVTPMNPRNVVTNAAYILFYKAEKF